MSGVKFKQLPTPLILLTGLGLLLVGVLLQPLGSVYSWNLGPFYGKPDTPGEALQMVKHEAWQQTPFAIVTFAYKIQQYEGGKGYVAPQDFKPSPRDPCPDKTRVSLHTFFGLKLTSAVVSCGGMEVRFR